MENTSLKIEISALMHDSITDGPGLRFVVFSQGCTHQCVGCHNTQTWKSGNGQMVSVEHVLEQVQKNPLIQGVTFSGGEPFEQPEAFTALAKGIKELGLEIAAYSGYTAERLLENKKTKELLQNIDILVDGKFEIDKKSYDLKFKGSSNQRTLDAAQTAKQNKPVLVTSGWWKE